MLGPRQVGKTTLALQVAEGTGSTYLDLESPADRGRISEPELYFADHTDELVILDEIHRAPGIFEAAGGRSTAAVARVAAFGLFPAARTASDRVARPDR